MEDLIKQYCEIRDFLIESVREKVEVFMTGIWDPLSKYIIIRETNEIIKKEIAIHFPHFSAKNYPRCKFKIFEEEHYIEAGIQNYFSDESNLIFLGTNDLGSVIFDYYMRDTWGSSFDHMFIARYGHDKESIYTGSKTAQAEYFMGAMTPLSIAYGMALEDGFVN